MALQGRGRALRNTEELVRRQKSDGGDGEREVGCGRDLGDGDGAGGGGSRREIKQRCQPAFLGSADSMPPSPTPTPTPLLFFLWPNHVLFIVLK